MDEIGRLLQAMPPFYHPMITFAVFHDLRHTSASLNVAADRLSSAWEGRDEGTGKDQRGEAFAASSNSPGLM